MPRSLFGQLDVSKQPEQRQAIAPSPQTSPSPTPQKTGGIFTTLGKGAMDIGKEVYKSVARPFFTPVAGVMSGITGKDVELPGWAGNARASVDLDKQSRIAGGAALEAASLIPAGKGLQALRAVKGAKSLVPLAVKEAQYGALTGAAGAAGYTLGREEDATVGDVTTSAAMGGAFGGLLGGVAPLVTRGVQKSWSKVKGWNEAADQAIASAEALRAAERKPAQMAAEGVIDVGPTTPMQPPDVAGPTTQAVDIASLGDEVAEFVPPKAPDAVPLDAKLEKKAISAGFKEWQPRLISDMSRAERMAAREMLAMAEDKSKNILARHPLEKATAPIIDQVEHLRGVRDASGAALDEVVEQMPSTPISLKEPVSLVDNWLAKRDIDILTDDAGRIEGLDFSRSKFGTAFSKKDQAVISEIFKQLFPKQARGQEIFRTPKEIRKMRQLLFNVLESQKRGTDPFSSETEQFISSLRTELNKPLASASPEYANLNRNYAVATDTLDTFYRFLGKDFYDAGKDDLINRVNELLPRLVSNTSAKPGVIFNTLLEGAKKTGMPEQTVTDPRRLVYIANMLDQAYDLNAPRGFQGSIETGVENVARKMGGVAQMGTSAARLDPLGVAQGAFSLFKPDEALRRRRLLKEMIESGLDETLPPMGGSVPPRAGQEAFGAVAGLEPEFDEEGNPIGMKYDPVKGALGVAGGIAVKKLRGNKPAFDKYAIEESLKALPTKTIKIDNQTVKTRVLKEPMTLFHTTRKDVGDLIQKDGFKPSSQLPEEAFKGGGYGQTQSGISFSYTPKGASHFGISQNNSTLKTSIKPGARIVEIPGVVYAEDVEEMVPMLLKKKVDAVFIGGGEDEILVLNPKILGQVDDTFSYGGTQVKKMLDYFDNQAPDKITESIVEPFQGLEDLSLKTLEKLKGRSTVSKQFIEDLAKTPDLKQAERDVINKALAGIKGKEVNVKEFADKVKAELLPLKVQEGFSDAMNGQFQRYENIVLPPELRGPIENYSEHVYESPIKTSAGQSHFPDSQNYFGHTRVEDISNDTRRVIEVQSDLYQRGRLESEMPSKMPEVRMNTEQRLEYQRARMNGDEAKMKALEDSVPYDEGGKRTKEVAKLQQYSNPTAHFRMIREEVKRAAQDGKTKLQFPTGETAMKIEGLGEQSLWVNSGDYRLITRDMMSRQAAADHFGLRPDDLKIGKEVKQFGDENTPWIITEVLGDGKFKAVPNRSLEFENEEAVYNLAMKKGYIDKEDGTWDMVKATSDPDILKKMADSYLSETFDISGKVDKENPIYKFYDKEVQKYLKSKYNAKPVTDAQGVTWMEVEIKPEMGKGPVEAFAAVPAVGAMGLANEERKKKKKKSP